MKNLKFALAGFLVAAACASLTARADGTNFVSSVKPDLLKTCPVSGDKLGGDMGKPYVFAYQGQEVKVCCPMCKADFDANRAKYLKKIRDADKPAKTDK